MPKYTYKCSKCKFIFDKYRPVSRRDKTVKCPECLGPASRSFVDEIKGSKVDALLKENERWSWSMGVNKQDIPAAMKKFPGSTYHPETGQLLIKSRQHKLAELKRRGMEEY